MEPQASGAGGIVTFRQLPGESACGHLWPAVSTLICFGVSAQRRCKVLGFCHFSLERYDDKNILSEFLPKESKAILKASEDK